MISIEERKLALFIQTNSLKKELDNLKQCDYRESELNTCQEQRAHTEFTNLVISLNTDSKGK